VGLEPGRQFWSLLRALATAAAVALTGALPAAARPGDLDSRFGVGGRTVTAFGTVSVANAVAGQPDGKIIAVGRSGDARTGDIALARYNADGSADATFGTRGTVVTPFTVLEDLARAVVVQPDGKIVVAGFAGSEVIGDFALARYDSNGTLDPTFGSGGKVTTDLSGGLADGIRAIAALPGGTLLAAGAASVNMGLARYSADGALDRSFGTGGKEVVHIGLTGAHAFSIVSLPDERFLIAGNVVDDLTRSDFLLARFNADGTLDPTFGTRGVTTTDFTGIDDVAFAVTLQDDGRIVVAGDSNSIDVTGALGDVRFAIARYTSDGNLDQTFGSGGKVEINPTAAADGLRGAFVQPDGKIVVGGFTDELHALQSFLDPLTGNFAVARLNPDGSRDAAFGSNGVVTTDFATGADGGRAIVGRQGGRILVAGGATQGVLSFGLAQYVGQD
jgi:uncharacterized delta-60 repeat protein